MISLSPPRQRGDTLLSRYLQECLGAPDFQVVWQSRQMATHHHQWPQVMGDRLLMRALNI